jgi:phage repressor protein C with HTH and peptisase S24 domain
VRPIEQLTKGQDVYVQRHDGKATFKQVVGAPGSRGSQLQLVAINPRFRDQLHPSKSDIAMTAVATRIVDKPGKG